MLALLTRISPVWYLLLPAGLAWGVWARYRQMHQAVQLGLVSGRAWGKLKVTLGTCGLFLLFSFASIFYETVVWLPAAAGGLTFVMALLLRSASRGVHLGLRGFYWPMPEDGLTLVMLENKSTPPLGRWWVWRLAPAAPMLTALALAASSSERRWLIWLMMGAGALAPTLLVAHRRMWITPLVLLPASAGLFWHASTLQARLPPGQWFTPWTAARCSAQLALAGDGTAWCFNPHTETAYHFSLQTGIVLDEHLVEGAREVLVASPRGVWIWSFPFNRVAFVSPTGAESLIFSSPVATLRPQGDSLWVIDWSRSLRVYNGRQYRVELPTPDGLFNAPFTMVELLPDGSVWTATERGALRRDPATGEWQSFGPEEGFRGMATGLAVGPDSRIWLLQTWNPANSARVWWVSAQSFEASWRHYNLAALTGLQASQTHDAIAVDGRGRLWFTAVSAGQFEKHLGGLNADGTLAFPVRSLGRFPGIEPGRLLTSRPGVVGDGEGGIYLYNGESEPLRHWRP